MTTKELYEQAVHQYCEQFCDLMWEDSTVYDIDDWVSGDIGGIICIADYWFNFSTIKEVVDKRIDRDTVFEWYNYSLNGGNINLHNYWKGVRDDQNHIPDFRKKVDKKKEFEAKLDEIMAKIYEQDSWIIPEYKQIKMFIYTKLAPRDWSKKDKQIVNSADTIDDLESI
jgi:hypothetical protein